VQKVGNHLLVVSRSAGMADERIQAEVDRSVGTAGNFLAVGPEEESLESLEVGV